MLMMPRLLQHLGAIFRVHSLDQLFDLVSPESHPTFLQDHRCRLIFERIHFFAYLMAILVPLWLLIDLILLPLNALLPILIIRILSTIGFIYQAKETKWVKNQSNSWLALGLLLINLPISFFVSAYFLLDLPMDDSTILAIQLYSLMPYIAIGILGMFPFTMLEGAMFAVPLSLLVISGWAFYTAHDLLHFLPTIWLLIIMLGIVFVTSTLQLQYMISFIGRSDYDPVTGALTRRSGMENLIRIHEKAAMNNEQMSVALISLDDSQEILDKQGYPTFDHLIQEAAETLHEVLRHNDLLVRWTEHWFLLILPDTDCPGAAITMERIRSKGICTMPDETPVTASIGVVERSNDHIKDVDSLLELLEKRRKEAEHKGRDRAELGSVLPCS